MVSFSLGALKKFSKKRETRIKKEIAEVLQQASYSRRDLDDEIPSFDLELLARITLTLISSFAITSCLPSAFLYALCELFEK